MKYLLLAVFALSSIYSFSQTTFTPEIKRGSKLTYSLVTNDGSVSIVVKVDSLTPTYVRFAWSTPNQGTGTWVIKEKSRESANSGLWSQLEPGKEIQLPDNQSVVIFSKAQFAGIQKDKKTEFDMVNYTLKTASPQQHLKLNNKDVDALYLENDNGTSKIWILNNPSFPAILKIEGNTAGPDAELKSVE